jgi:dipeptidyl aminopeptidase/acylaminoacyl peptidase
VSRKPLNAEVLWRIPRVGAPAPLPDGSGCVVPVTTYDLASDEGLTRLWHVGRGHGETDQDAASAGMDDGAERGLAPGASAARPLTSADVSAGSPRVSPDGRTVAFLRKPGGDQPSAAAPEPTTGLAAGGPKHPEQPQLYLLSLAGGEAERQTDLPLGVAGVRWLPDGRLVLSSAVYEEALTLEEAAAKKRELADSKLNVHVSEARVVRFWDHWLTEGRIHHLYLLDPDAGTLIDLLPDSTRWMPLMDPLGSLDVAPDGRELAFGAARSQPPHTRLLTGVFTLPIPARGQPAPEPAPPATLISPDDDASNASRPRYAPDGATLIYGLRREFDFYADRTRLVAHDRRDGSQITLTEDWDASADGWTFDPADPDTLHLLAEVESRTGLYSLDLPAARRDPAAHPPRERLRGGSFGGLVVRGGRAFLTRHALDAPPEVFVADVRGDRAPDGESQARTREEHPQEEAHDLERLSFFTAEAMADVALGAVTEMFFDGHGGDRVQAFLVWPPGITPPAAGAEGEGAASIAEPLPLVHMIHGGPHGAFGDGWHWRWSAQAFAAPGHLCALVNFHGSTGWGDAFTRSILGRWGDQPATDIEAATDTLLARGWVDGKRMAITGGSYGGYLVSWLCTQTQRYACAVNHAGVCDFQTQFASDLTQGRPRSFGGELWEDLPGLDRWNPLRHAAGLETPMLVLHGQKDYRVPYAQGLQIYAIYQARELPARLAVYPDENHWILKPNNSMHWYGEVLGWLDRWLGAQA